MSMLSKTMIGKRLLTFEPLREGILVRRYKRFLAEVELLEGKMVTAHCANTGPMKGVLCPGNRVRLRYAPSPSRKLAWSWEQIEVPSANGDLCWVGINTMLPNRLLRRVIEAGLLEQKLGPVASLRREVPYGCCSRVDLLLTPTVNAQDSRLIFMEVKNTTWSSGDIALFPDTVTKRGQKHLKELIGVLSEARAVLVPCLSRDDVKAFAPGDEADPYYGQLFRQAIEAGVEVLPCCFGFEPDAITWQGERPVRI
ncbi:DNA/RNA nuclease SfsA [cyanobiont of Ornithocercus magnificus]|nr:DNA/RNA nuclease SfsA [cyanobiont of Ornithocercus magnificus]